MKVGEIEEGSQNARTDVEDEKESKTGVVHLVS
jgi:hypothetical protein